MRNLLQSTRAILRADYENPKEYKQVELDHNLYTEIPESGDSLRWQYLAVQYRSNPTWDTELMLWFEQNRTQFDGHEQLSVLRNTQKWEAIASIMRRAFMLGNDAVYNECMIYWKSTVALLTQFCIWGQRYIVAPCNYGQGRNTYRDAGFGALKGTPPNFEHAMPKDWTSEMWKHESALAVRMIRSLRMEGILPTVNLEYGYVPPVKDAIMLNNHQNGLIAYCPVLTGAGYPQWLAAGNQKGDLFFESWKTAKLHKTQARCLGDQGEMKIPFMDRSKIRKDLDLGPENTSISINSFRKVPTNTTWNIPLPEEASLFRLPASRVFKVGRFNAFADSNMEDAKKALITHLLLRSKDGDTASTNILQELKNEVVAMRYPKLSEENPKTA